MTDARARTQTLDWLNKRIDQLERERTLTKLTIAVFEQRTRATGKRLSDAYSLYAADKLLELIKTLDNRRREEEAEDEG